MHFLFVVETFLHKVKLRGIMFCQSVLKIILKHVDVHAGTQFSACLLLIIFAKITNVNHSLYEITMRSIEVTVL